MGTGEVVAEEGQIIDEEVLARIASCAHEIEVAAQQQLSTARQFDVFMSANHRTRRRNFNLNPEHFRYTRLNLFPLRTFDPDAKKPPSRAYSHIDSETIDKILRVKAKLEVHRVPPIITGGISTR